MATKRPIDSTSSFSSSSIETGESSHKYQKKGNNHAAARGKTLFKHAFTNTNAKNVKEKYIYLYRDSDGEVLIDFRNETDGKGIVLTIDQWITLLSKKSDLSRHMVAYKEFDEQISTDIYVKMNIFQRNPYIHIRQYYIDTEKNTKPTSVGVAFSNKEWELFMDCLSDIKKDIKLLSAKPNCKLDGKSQTLHLIDVSSDGEYKYVWVEKMVYIESTETDLDKVLKEYDIKMALLMKEIREEQEVKDQAALLNRKRVMFASILTVNNDGYESRKEDEYMLDIEDKTDIFDLFFECGKAMSVSAFDPITLYNLVLEEYGDLIVHILDDLERIPADFIPFTTMANKLYVKKKKELLKYK